MALLEFLVRFVNGNPFCSVFLVWLLWLFWPGVMIIVGFVFESRFIPISEGQSKAFMPGDLSLAVMFVSLLNIHERTISNKAWWGYSPNSWAIIIVVTTIIAILLRWNDAQNYPNRRSVMSPTKITHDLVGYFLIPTVLVGLGLPQLIESIAYKQLFQHQISWGVLGVAILLYVSCVIYDVIRPATVEDMELRHPANWKPIWR